MPIQPGGQLGGYRIEGLLGQGGMGAVYRAFDTTLHRRVAIKVLSEGDEQARGKLLAEARAASALSHPNVATVFEVGEHDGQPYIVMELVEGKPLSELIPADGLPQETVIRYGLQIADALAHAHEKGIIHRDLKSQNVVITPEGRAKVLDFGLATQVETQDAEAVTVSVNTRADVGRIAGTLAYMAPEILRGEEATARSDVWALGVLLYELASGTLPFVGPTRTDVVSAIVKETPASLPAKVSPGLRNIIQHCLTKEPARRYPQVIAVHAALEAIESDVTLVPPSTTSPGRATQTWRVAAAGLGLVVVAAGLSYLAGPGAPATSRSTTPRLANPVQITSATGVEEYPAWSPDGQMLAYVSRQAGNPDVWIAPLGGIPLNRTADHSGEDLGPAWSPDGRDVAFYSDRDGGGFFVMPALSGAPRRVVPVEPFNTRNALISVAWLSAGTQLAYEDRNVLAIVDIRTGELRRVDLPRRSAAGPNVQQLSWSADERYVAYWTGSGTSSANGQIWLLRPTDSEAIAVTDSQFFNVSPSWAPDGRSLYFVSNRGGSRDLWLQRITPDGTGLRGEPERVSVGIGMWHAVLSPDGERLAYVRGREVANVWRMPLLADRPATWADAVQMTFDEAYTESADISPDGTRVLISSDRGGNPDLWTVPRDGGEFQQLTTDPAMDAGGRWSPDGHQIAFYSLRSGNRDIWVMPAGGGPARQLTTHETTDRLPDWSPDGREIVFAAQRSGSTDLWIVDVGTGDERPLVVAPGNQDHPVWSPDGEWVVYRSEGTLWRVAVAGGDPEQLTGRAAERPFWSAGGSEVYFLDSSQRQMNFWAVSLENRSERQLTAFEGKPGRVVSPEVHSTDGQYLYFLWRNDIGDIWLADLVWDEESRN